MRYVIDLCPVGISSPIYESIGKTPSTSLWAPIIDSIAADEVCVSAINATSLVDEGNLAIGSNMLGFASTISPRLVKSI